MWKGPGKCCCSLSLIPVVSKTNRDFLLMNYVTKHGGRRVELNERNPEVFLVVSPSTQFISSSLGPPKHK